MSTEWRGVWQPHISHLGRLVDDPGPWVLTRDEALSFVPPGQGGYGRLVALESRIVSRPMPEEAAEVLPRVTASMVAAAHLRATAALPHGAGRMAAERAERMCDTCASRYMLPPVGSSHHRAPHECLGVITTIGELAAREARP